MGRKKTEETDGTRGDVVQSPLGALRLGWGPLRRLVLYSGGANRSQLNRAKIDEGKFRLLGSTVLVTTAMAYVGVLLATSMLVEQPPPVLARLMIAAFGAAIIYTIDRVLVSMSLIPYQFDPNVMRTIWDPKGQIDWYRTFQSRRPGHGALRAILALPITVGIRLALSFLLATVIADLFVIAEFRPDIEKRAAYVYNQDLQDQRDKANATYAATMKLLDARAASITTSIDAKPDVAPLVTSLGQLQTKLTSLQSIDAKLQSYANAEVDGVKGVAVLDTEGRPTGQVTTGRRGCSLECKQANQKVAELNGEIKVTSAQLASTQRQLGQLQSTYGRLQRTEYEDIITERNKAETIKDTALTDIGPNVKVAPAGLLLRKTALHLLENDAKPWTEAEDPESGCRGSVWCSLHRLVFPPGTLGSYVGSQRLILILIDTLPISLKIMFSFRRRRVYDAVVAAEEEAETAKIIECLTAEFTDTGSRIERLHAERLAGRTADGAAFIQGRATTDAQEQQTSVVKRSPLKKLMNLNTRPAPREKVPVTASPVNGHSAAPPNGFDWWSDTTG